MTHTDGRRVDGVRRDPDAVRRLIASYGRNVATDAALRIIGRGAEEPLSEPTLHDYLRALRRLFLIEDQESWKPRLRSRIRLVATPKRHLADPSLAVAALGAWPSLPSLDRRRIGAVPCHTSPEGVRISYPQGITPSYQRIRLRIDDLRGFYRISEATVEVLTIIPEARTQG